MSQANGGEIEGSMDRVARITLYLGGFMLLLLIAAPFTFDTDSSGYLASYVIYSLFLTSIGVIIGVSLMWLNDPRREPERERRIRETSSPMLSEDQQKVVDILSSNGNSMWRQNWFAIRDSRIRRLADYYLAWRSKATLGGLGTEWGSG